jgi:hypothetical protein
MSLGEDVIILAEFLSKEGKLVAGRVGLKPPLRDFRISDEITERVAEPSGLSEWLEHFFSG